MDSCCYHALLGDAFVTNKDAESVIRGALELPVKRERGIWVLMKKPGDAFRRLYQFTVTEEHLGGGKYGPGTADSFGEILFYVSTCK